MARRRSSSRAPQKPLLLLLLLLALLTLCLPSIVFVDNAPDKCLSGEHDPSAYSLDQCHRHKFTPDCLRLDIPISQVSRLEAIRQCFQCCANYWLQAILAGSSYNKYSKLTLAQQFKIPVVFSATELIGQMQKIALQGGIRSALEVHNEHVRPPILLYAETLQLGAKMLQRHYPRKISFVSVFNDSRNSSYSIDNVEHLKRYRNLVAWWWHSPESEFTTSFYKLEKFQILRGSRFTEVSDFVIATDRPYALTCLTVRSESSDASDSCYASIRSQLACDIVYKLPISKEEKAQKKGEYLALLAKSKFVSVIVNSQPESKKYAGMNSPWVAEAILSGAVPIIPTHTCDYYQPKIPLATRVARGELDYMNRLPILFVSLESPNLRPINVTEIYEKAARSTAFSVSPFFLPFWLQRLLPIRPWEMHIPRGEKKVREFVATVVPELQTLKLDKATSVEIVIPRCCELISGELAWMQLALDSMKATKMTKKKNLHFTVYYKCPYCLPRSLGLDKITVRNDSVRRTTATGAKNVHSEYALEQQQQLAHVHHALRNSAGVRILDSFTNASFAKGHLTERIAFDTTVNAKEASAYLAHINTRYDSLADVTIFLHTTPALHVHSKSFLNLLRRIDSDPTPALDTVGSYESVNTRFFSGVWAHDPARCIMSLLDFSFANSTTPGDERRLPPKSRDANQFAAMRMSDWTAAQFAVKRRSVTTRSMAFWKRLLGATKGELKLDGCDPRTDDKGTLVASALERLWHNYFVNGASSKNPLCLPCPKDDPRCLKADVEHCL